MRGIKGKISKVTTHSKEYKIVTNPKISEPYWDEGIHFHYGKGKNRRDRRRKGIFSYQRRMFRTWKHNRKTQWKEKMQSSSEN